MVGCQIRARLSRQKLSEVTCFYYRTAWCCKDDITRDKDKDKDKDSSKTGTTPLSSAQIGLPQSVG